jgi:hypothetical protein
MGVENEHLVEEFSTEAAADPAFHDRVCSGPRIVVLMIWIPSLAKTASNMLVNLESRSRIKNVNCGTWSPRVHERIAGLLGHPVCDGMRGDAENADPAVDAACWPTVGSTHPI